MMLLALPMTSTSIMFEEHNNTAPRMFKHAHTDSSIACLWQWSLTAANNAQMISLGYTARVIEWWQQVFLAWCCWV